MTLFLLHESKEEQLQRELDEVRQSIATVRRGLFARHSELERKYQETYFELELLKSSIAKQDIKIWTNGAKVPKVIKHTAEPDLFSCIA